MRTGLLALDLEATLIDNAMSVIPRPGLFRFLTFCDVQFERVALLTTVDEESAREVLEQLAENRDAPSNLVSRIEYIDWQGEFKDLRCAANISPDEVLFVDDDDGWIHPSQIDRWVPIAPWHGGDDRELPRVQSVLENRLAAER